MTGSSLPPGTHRRKFMRIRIGYDLGFDVPRPTAMVLMLFVRPEREPTLEAPEAVRIEPAVPIEHFVDGFGNHCGRLVAPAGPLRITNHAVVRDSGLHDEARPDAQQHPVDELPPNVLQYL